MCVTKMDSENAKEVIRYHDQTKHHFHRYAKSSGYMDWKNQPNPFRHYEGCPRIPLPLGWKDPPVSYPDMYQSERLPAEPVNLTTVGQFLTLSLGLSAWKVADGAKWALRMNPSSGNLHPTEAHLLLPNTVDTQAGVYHYAPFFHALERRAIIPNAIWGDFNSVFGTGGFFIALTSIFWRESWKYGERAFRYCQLDVGHALAALCLAANLFGWRLIRFDQPSDSEIETLLGFDKTDWDPADREHPELLCCVGPRNAIATAVSFSDGILNDFSLLDFSGSPNRLSQAAVTWEAIDRVARFARKPVTDSQPVPFADDFPPISPQAGPPAAEIIRKRRSGVGFDGKGIFPKEKFFSLLSRTLPRADCPPFDGAIPTPSVHLLIFIHRVEDLSPGLYFFIRNRSHLARLQQAMKPTLMWQPVQDGLPLFRLTAEEVVLEAIEVSCHQEIAGHGCFSLGMIADFKHTVEKAPYRYRHLFWEAGMIGQVMYLEAEAHGFRGTGIGCFFDDAVHDILGFTDNAFQSLYHFTVGIPVDDKRVTTLPAYHHLHEQRIFPL
jgi:SagB-type dehydrogenase family enzyme